MGNTNFKTESDMWKKYYEKTAKLGPRELAKFALDLFCKENKKGMVIDLGSGNGRDSIYFIENGWNALAIDKEQSALDILTDSIPENCRDNFNSMCNSFEEIKLPKSTLINAEYSIPFCYPDEFKELWNKIYESINIGGRFAGNFFGLNDSWSDSPKMSFHSKEEVLEMLDKFEIEYFKEVERDAKTALGENKHWHTFEVVARKVK